MDLNYYNYISISLFGTGLSLCLFRWIRSIRSKKCECIIKRCKTIVITGATSGLGKACAYELSKRNCKLILGCRNVFLGQKVVDNINKYKPIARLIPLDLSDLQSIRNFCNTLSNEKIDVLINNAGVMTGHFRMVHCTQTEEDMTVNYLGHFYLTNLLLENLKMNNKTNLLSDGDSVEPSRVVFISSSLCKRGQLDIDNLDLSKNPYSPMQAYANSKLAMCLFSRELHRRLHVSGGWEEDDDKTAPINMITMFTGGMVHTGLSKHMISSYNVLLQPVLRFLLWIVLKDPSDACHAIVHCAISDELKHSSGELFSNFKVIPWPDRVDESMELCGDLWTKSCSIVGLEQVSIEDRL